MMKSESVRKDPSPLYAYFPVKIRGGGGAGGLLDTRTSLSMCSLTCKGRPVCAFECVYISFRLRAHVLDVHVWTLVVGISRCVSICCVITRNAVEVRRTRERVFFFFF